MGVCLTVVLLVTIRLYFSLAQPNHNEFVLRVRRTADEQTKMNLPKIGENFRDLRKNNRTYVDKTQFVATLLDHFYYSPRRYYILMRPPKFGKTTFIDMMASFFRGEKHLFEGTSIYKRGNTEAKNGTWIEYPVIHMNFGEMLDDFIASPTPQYFRYFYRQRIESHAAKYNVYCEGTFFLLIKALVNKYKLPVIVLGDEYDKPIEYALGVLNNIEVAEHMQNVARSFLHYIMDEKSSIRLAFVVGALKFQVDQETLGKYYDITHHREFSSALGFTHQEIETYFQSSVREFAENTNRTSKDIMEELIQRYDGYRFSGDENMTRVFNPVSILESLRKEDVAGNQWYSNHSLEYVVEMLAKRNLTADSLQNFTVPREILYDLNNRQYPVSRAGIPVLVYMLLRGYLTIITYEPLEDLATLGYANDEIRRIITLRFNEAKERFEAQPKTTSRIPDYG